MSESSSRGRAGADAREAFVDRVKRIDPMFREGDLARFWPALSELVAMAPNRRDLSQKKSHYLASLAARSLARDDPRAAVAFLDFADGALNPAHLTPFLSEERIEIRREALRRLSGGTLGGAKAHD